MEFLKSKNVKKQELVDLYHSVQWAAYTNDEEKLERAIQQSLYVEQVREGGRLIALLRAVGDGETILYIQDILVHPDFQRQGIGKQLLENIIAAYPDVRQKVLMTDNEEKTISFYESIGGKNIYQHGGVSFMF